MCTQHTRKLLAAVCLLVCVGFSAGAQSKYDFLLNKSYAELAPTFDTTVFQHIQHLSKDAFDKELADIQKLAEQHDDNLLYMEARLHEWYCMQVNKLFPSTQKSIDVLNVLLKEAQKKKLHYHEMLIRFQLVGEHFYNAHNYDIAFTESIKNYAQVMKTPAALMPTKKAILLNTGNIYYNFRDYKSARKYVEIADSIDIGWRPKVFIQCKNTLGLLHRMEGRYDSAVHYFEQGIEIAKESNLNIWIAILKGNIGISYYLQGDYKQAIPLLEYDAKRSIEYGEFDNGVNTLVKLADAYIRTGRANIAANRLDTAWKYVDSMKDVVKHLPQLYEMAGRQKIAVGAYKEAHSLRDSSIFYKDSLLRRDNIIQLARVQNKIRQEVHNKEIKALTLEKELITTTRNTLIVILILISIITYLVINRQRIKHRANKAMLTADMKLAENKLQNAVEQLDNYTHRLQEKNALIEKSASEIQKLQKNIESTNTSQQHNETLQQLYDSTILTDEEWDEFKKLFDKVHSGFLHRLKEKMPELSPADTRFIVLSKLNMTNKEMAGILGVQPDTIRSYKHRLRKKFNLQEDANIRDFVDSI